MEVFTHSKLFRLSFMKRYDAIVLGRYGFFRGVPTDELLKHESVHQEQMDEHGILLFYVIYLIDYFAGLIKYRNHWKAYMNIPFEIEAYESHKE